MQTGHRNQLKPRLADAAPASTVGLTDTKAYTPRWTPIEIETYGRETNDKEDLRGQPQLLRVQQLLVLATILVQRNTFTLARDDRVMPYQSSTINSLSATWHPQSVTSLLNGITADPGKVQATFTSQTTLVYRGCRFGRLCQLVQFKTKHC